MPPAYTSYSLEQLHLLQEPRFLKLLYNHGKPVQAHLAYFTMFKLIRLDFAIVAPFLDDKPYTITDVFSRAGTSQFTRFNLVDLCFSLTIETFTTNYLELVVPRLLDYINK